MRLAESNSTTLCLRRQRVADEDGAEELKMHVRGHERPEAAQVSEQAGGQQSGHNPSFETHPSRVGVIRVERVDIPCHADKEGNIGLRQCPAIGCFLPQTWFPGNSFSQQWCLHSLHNPCEIDVRLPGYRREVPGQSNTRAGSRAARGDKIPPR